jgi:hypothetical protein
MGPMPNDIAIAPETEAESSAAVLRAETLVVIDDESCEQATAFLKIIKSLTKRIEEDFEVPKKAAKKAYDDLRALITSYLDPLERAERVAKEKIGAYLEGKKRAAAAEAARVAAEARAKAEEFQRERAAKLKAQGAVQAAAFIASQPVTVAAPPPAEVTKPSGISTKTVWKARVTDKHALIRHVALFPDLEALLEPRLPPLNEMARAAAGGQSTIPGVEFYSEVQVASRA